MRLAGGLRVEIRILGPLEVRGGDGPLPLGGAKQRALLALLVLDANRVVSRERLIDGLWGDEPPEAAVTSVQVYVSRLRKLLPDGALVTQPPGYVLQVPPEEVDLFRFERLLAEGRTALAGYDPERAARLVRDAIELWRGPALAEFAPEPFAQIEGRRLEDLRMHALEQRIEADLMLGLHGEVVGELEVLIAEHPHRERLREQLMLALYRSRRQADALAVYRDVRATLADLGLEPGLVLQQLERQILNHDSELDAPRQAPASAGAHRAHARPLERKQVTVLFVALATANEAEEDLELTTALLDRAHEEAAAEIESVGATVERGLVGALLATFASRANDGENHTTMAVAAAIATHDRLTKRFGETLLLRMGLESGEAIVGRPGSFAAGMPATTAARLVSLARPGEIVVGVRAATAVGAGFELEQRGAAHVVVGALVPSRPRSTVPPGREACGFSPSLEVRKTVTILFADLVESTELTRRLDAEALRRLMSRYFDAMRSAIEHHGGIVEKFIGDAVMAVFGVPLVHEDDALRAVRAAAEMRDSLSALNDDLEKTWGVRLKGRIGVNSGEVIAGDFLQGHLIVTGEVVNAAKRLEEAAETGEILLGDAVYRLVRDAVVADGVADRSVKRGRTVSAHRLVEVRRGVSGRARRFDSPLIGREQELSALRSAFEGVVRDRACRVFAVVGEAGVGKSRLVQELVGLVGAEARVVRGRCLPYGDGITYWPLNEIVQGILCSDAALVTGSIDAIAELLPDDEKAGLVAELISAATGLGGSSAGAAEETFWAVRRLFEGLARVRPLVVIVDDIQWAEPTFVELIEYLVALARDAAILIICAARPEVFESHPEWGRKLVGPAIRLEPLSDDDCRRLITNVVGRGPLRHDAESRVAAAAGGNPLFLEELIAMLEDRQLLTWEDGRWAPAGDLHDLPVPDTINSLLAARLESLPAEARALLVRASVEGLVFHRDAVRAMTYEPSDSRLESNLAALARRDLIRPERSDFPGDEAYHFRHALIRDAAYESLTKATRADLHERYADWLEAVAGKRMREFEEIAGYHLEQAYRCRLEIGSPAADLAAVGERASNHLGSAGRKALWRGDNLAATGLLERALELKPSSRIDVALEIDLAHAQPTPQGAAAIADAAAERARVAGDSAGEALARVASGFHRLHAGETGADELEAFARAALPLLEERGDHDGLVHVWLALGFVANARCRYGDFAQAAEKALLHARLAGQRPTDVFSLDLTLVLGPTPADEALRTLDGVLPEAPHPETLLFRAQLLAMLERFDEAWEVAHEASDRLLELTGGADGGEFMLADIAALAGDYEAAARHLRGFCDFLTEHGQRAMLSTFAPMLGRALCILGRYDEASRHAELGRELGEEHDVATQALWRQVQALVESNSGRYVQAEELAREAVALIDQTDALNFAGAALSDLAQVLLMAGRVDDAAAAFDEALERYERKRNAAAARQTRARIATVRERTQPVCGRERP
jgi:class 3 adenylate cyclase